MSSVCYYGNEKSIWGIRAQNDILYLFLNSTQRLVFKWLHSPVSISYTRTLSILNVVAGANRSIASLMKDFNRLVSHIIMRKRTAASHI